MPPELSPEQHAQLRALFEAIVDLPASAHEARLIELCADPSLREQALRLVQAAGLQTSRATRLSRELSGIVEGIAGPEVGVGAELGVWKLTRQIGSGGMGAVFLAQRGDGHFEQLAAIKVLQGVPSAAALELLSSERQILATLSHPNIARLFDGGATPKGRPYLVMEYVAGVALDQWVKSTALSVPQILRLFLVVIDAVAFAHARLVVHCDLKPSNILVDQQGRPVLLDFGIARLLDRGQLESTADPRQAYTPHYASPELSAGSPVGTAADVYSLGVILSELLTGRLDRDLSAIVAKARAAEVRDRYASVSMLGLDLTRWLERRPVSARTPHWRYRLGRLLRRRWPVAAAISLFVLTISVFTARLYVERNRALSAEHTALRESATARAVSDFLQELFRGVDLEAGGARDVSALALVERGRARIDQELAGQPAIQAELLVVLARVYASLGEPVQAEATYRRALELERGLSSPRPQKLVTILAELSGLLGFRNRFADAEVPAREAVLIAEAMPVADAERNAAQLTALAGLANVHSGLMQFDAAETVLVRTLALRQQAGETEDRLAETWYAMGVNARQRGDLPRALSEFSRSSDAFRRRYGESNPRTLDALQGLGVTLGSMGRLQEAERALRQVLELRLALHGARSSKVSSVQAELAYLLTQQGHYIESAEFTEQVLVHDAALEGEQSPVYARTLNNLAFAYQNMGDVERCVDSFKRSLAIRIATLPPGDLAIARAQNNLARFLMWLGRTEEARPLVEASLAARTAGLPPEHEERVESLISATEWARRAGDLATARSHWAELEPKLAKVHVYTQLEARRTLAWLSISERRADALQRINEYIEGLQTELGANHPALLRGQVAQAEMLEALGEHELARTLALQLQMRFKALPRAYPAHSVFHARLQRIVQS